MPLAYPRLHCSRAGWIVCLDAIGWAERRTICCELVNLGIYDCAVPDLHCRYDTLISRTLKRIETSPLLW